MSTKKTTEQLVRKCFCYCQEFKETGKCKIKWPHFCNYTDWRRISRAARRFVRMEGAEKDKHWREIKWPRIRAAVFPENNHSNKRKAKRKVTAIAQDTPKLDMARLPKKFGWKD